MPDFQIFTRRIKSISGNGSTKVKITPTPGKRLYNVQLELSYVSTAGVPANNISTLMTALTEIRVKVGTRVRWRLSGTKLRDWCLLRGATFDFNGLPNIAAGNAGVQMTIPLSPEWFLPDVQDFLAWNPKLLGGDITIELDCTLPLTVSNAYERVNDDLAQPSIGILTMEVINPVAGGTAFYVEKELDSHGKLVMASIYPDSGASNQVSPASLYVGADDVFAYEQLSYAQNKEALERFSLTPEVINRTNVAGTVFIYDMVFVKDDGLARAIDLAAWGSAKFRIEAAASMSGTCDILLVRLENS